MQWFVCCFVLNLCSVDFVLFERLFVLTTVYSMLTSCVSVWFSRQDNLCTFRDFSVFNTVLSGSSF